MPCDGNPSSNRKALKMYVLAAGEMSETSAITESSYSSLDWIWQRLSEGGFYSQKPTARFVPRSRRSWNSPVLATLEGRVQLGLCSELKGMELAQLQPNPGGRRRCR